jgi:thiol-disulfide isomerase/thioredoxin
MSIMAFWGLLFLDLNKPGLIGIFIGLAYTFYSSFIIRYFVEEETQKLKLIKFIGPVIFLLLTLYTQKISAYILISPINIAFLIFCIALFSKAKFPKKEVQFFVVAFIYLYSFSVYNIWEHSNKVRAKNRYDFAIKATSIDRKIPDLSHYQFLNSNLDYIRLSEKNEYVIIETWNEKCPPCFKAMAEMDAFYEDIASKANQYYVYIPSRKRVTYDKIFSFEKIKDKSRILVDVNLQEDALLDQYPVFLVFNKKGKLVFSQIGYDSETKTELQKNILSVLK